MKPTTTPAAEQTETAEIFEPFTFRDGVRLAAVTYRWTRGNFADRRAVSVREIGEGPRR